MIGRGLKRRRPRRAATRWPARVSLVLGTLAVLFGLLAPPAGANYARISAEITCDRTVHWTATASSEGDDDERTNTRVLVEYRPAAGDQPLGGWEPAGPEGRFDPKNSFSFSGTTTLGDDADAVELRVTPLAAWGADGSGDPPGSPRFARAQLPEGCADQPIVATVTANCDAGGAVVRLRNDGTHAGIVTVAADGVALREIAIDPDATEELTVPLLESRPTPVRVATADFVLAEQTLTAQCGAGDPVATVVERCEARHAVLYATLGEAERGELRVRVEGAIVHQAALEAGSVAQRTLELPAAGAVAVEVAIDDRVVAAGPVGGCDTPVAGLVTCGVEGTRACEAAAGGTTTIPAPPPPPPPTTLDLTEDDPLLPRTGPWERAIAVLLGGGLLLVGGLAAASHDRRRPVHSALDAAVEPYRRLWWDER